ncbi:hypothetical protein EJA70_20125 [Pseudomonas sp. PB103]|uniref:hypothetical protein n=1 Tax=Pseudomonas sp. PB103 TaxID=2494698 RepID=UPI00131C0F74|nr:hypothetical protein [Pseudomonas sp. PB103]KAE9642040.1 hypothetical protein EJA70_20125 [Pseudomonas sp. PB103]
MLMLPYTKLPYEPKLSNVLSGISIYDREETLGQALWVYDPNKYEDQREIIKNFIIPEFDYLTYRHRFLIYKILGSHLQDTDFDFSEEFVSDYDDPRVLAWDETEIIDSRGFFEHIYEIASELWKDDLLRASLEDQTQW